MKKLVMTVAVLACVATMVSAQTVTSANMVGYTKVSAVGGELALVALNFGDDESMLVTELIGDQLPSGSALYVWNKSSQAYDTINKAARGGWPASAAITSGQGFWIQAAGLASNEVILSGEVLLSETNSVVLPVGLTATGYYYPVETPWLDTGLSEALPTGSALYLWNGTGYDIHNKAARGGWSTAGSAVVGPAQGFWVESPTSVNWDEERPFTP